MDSQLRANDVFEELTVCLDFLGYLANKLAIPFSKIARKIIFVTKVNVLGLAYAVTFSFIRN